MIRVSEHLADCPKEGIEFTVAPFYKLPSNKSIAITKEEMFIRQFKPSLNNLTLSRK